MKPVVATSVIIATMWTWNDFHLPLYFMSSAANRTLPMTVYYFYGENASQWNLVFADMMIGIDSDSNSVFVLSEVYCIGNDCRSSERIIALRLKGR